MRYACTRIPFARSAAREADDARQPEPLARGLQALFRGDLQACGNAHEAALGEHGARVGCEQSFEPRVSPERQRPAPVEIREGEPEQVGNGHGLVDKVNPALPCSLRLLEQVGEEGFGGRRGEAFDVLQGRVAECAAPPVAAVGEARLQPLGVRPEGVHRVGAFDDPHVPGEVHAAVVGEDRPYGGGVDHPQLREPGRVPHLVGGLRPEALEVRLVEPVRHEPVAPTDDGLVQVLLARAHVLEDRRQRPVARVVAQVVRVLEDPRIAQGAQLRGHVAASEGDGKIPAEQPPGFPGDDQCAGERPGERDSDAHEARRGEARHHLRHQRPQEPLEQPALLCRGLDHPEVGL